MQVVHVQLSGHCHIFKYVIQSKKSLETVKYNFQKLSKVIRNCKITLEMKIAGLLYDMTVVVNEKKKHNR